MNDTATAGGATGASLIPSTTDAFTIAHLVVVAIFAVAVIAAIIWGARLKRRRKTAERDIADHNSIVEQASPSAPDDEVVTAPVAAEPDPTPTPAPVPSPPITPTPTAAASHAPSGSDDAAPAGLSRDGWANEPIAASAPLEAAPAVEAAPQPTRATGGLPADASVSTLKGLGPKLATRLGELGITTVGQVAALSDEEAARLDAQLGPFSGRMMRDRWIEQARFLAAGDTAGFEAVFGRL